jgi:uncharacterized flavoprotein (TIGR03862 family)
LGETCFVGSSGRVFPKSFKASPLLRAWLRRLSALGVAFRSRQDWKGWSNDGALIFDSATEGQVLVRPDATVLALGGASWPRLGADGAWTSIARAAGMSCVPFVPANMGLLIDWSPFFIERFAGMPIKRLRIRCGDMDIAGEAVVTRDGLEGGAVYALGPVIRASLAEKGEAWLELDLRRDLDHESLQRRLEMPRGKASVSTWLHRAAGLDPVSIALLREPNVTGTTIAFSDPATLARSIKALPLRVTGMAGLDRAISSAGGLDRSELDSNLMIAKRPGVFVAGEMIDWEAPTGGYLLQACFSTGMAAGQGAVDWLHSRDKPAAS